MTSPAPFVVLLIHVEAVMDGSPKVAVFVEIPVPVGCSIKRIIGDHPSTASIEGIAVSEELPIARPRRARLS